MKNSSAHILIVEDDLVVARIQKFLLQKTVLVSPEMCSNGREALDFLDSISEETEKILVFLDLNMPEMNGWDFLEISRERSYAHKICVAVFTSSLYSEDEKKALSYEQVIGYYTKPVTPATFKEILSFPEVAAFFEPVNKSR